MSSRLLSEHVLASNSLVHNYLSRSSLTFLSQSWLPPDRGFSKLNTNGSRGYQTVLSYCGDVIQNVEGSWIRGISNLVVECDNASTIRLIKGDKMNDVVNSLVSSIRSFLNRCWMVLVVLGHRNANQVVDFLAKKCCVDGHSCKIYGMILDNVTNVMQANVSVMSNLTGNMSSLTMGN
ncbi:hypothetical protein V6N11_020493 [Hibiscus sabdariffa]|uniref:RNase H type-1 domain-containing protein n=1 Tax=Hibiscus sabdariffa TaxID=183260 RepID=A0ABR2Q8K8_9ROSI